MTDLKMAMAWLETGQYLVKHDEMSYSVRVTDFAEETDELRKVLLDALRKEPCEWCAEKEDSLLIWTKDPVEIEWDDREYTTRGWTWKELKPKYCPNCGRPLPAPPERSE